MFETGETCCTWKKNVASCADGLRRLSRQCCAAFFYSNLSGKHGSLSLSKPLNRMEYDDDDDGTFPYWWYHYWLTQAETHCSRCLFGSALPPLHYAMVSRLKQVRCRNRWFYTYPIPVSLASVSWKLHSRVLENMRIDLKTIPTPECQLLNPVVDCLSEAALSIRQRDNLTPVSSTPYSLRVVPELHGKEVSRIYKHDFFFPKPR